MSENITPNTDPTPQQTPPTAPQTPPTPPRAWSDDYVKDLREESKAHRLEAKAEKEARKAEQDARKDFEKLVRETLGLSENDPLDKNTLESVKNSFSQKATEKLIKAEIKALEGYDSKLVERLLDKSKIELDENGDPKNIADLVKELENEFPQIKTGSTTSTTQSQQRPPESGSNPPNSSGVKTPQQEYNELFELVKKNPRDQFLMKKLLAVKEKLNK